MCQEPQFRTDSVTGTDGSRPVITTFDFFPKNIWNYILNKCGDFRYQVVVEEVTVKELVSLLYGKGLFSASPVFGLSPLPE